MTTSETSFSPQQNLAIIAEAIAQTKENIRENGFYFLLWGWLISIASFAFFALHHYTSFAYYFLTFPFAAAAGISGTLIFYSRKKSGSTETYLSYFLMKMWAALGLSFFAVVFINVSQSHPPFTYTLIIAGVGTLASGLVMKFKPLIAGGILFFGAAILTIYVADDFKVLIHGAAIVSGYIIPGYALKYSKE